MNGEDKISFYRHEETNFARNFCSVCSALVPIHVAARDIVITPVGSLDSDVELSPHTHIFTDSKANWDELLNDIATFKEMPA